MRKNMNKITRALALSMATVLCLSACGNQSTNSNKETDKASEGTSISVQTSASEELEVRPYWELLDSVSDTSELPDWEGDTLDVTVWLAAGTTGMKGEITEDDIAFKEFERVTGVRFNVEESFDNGGNSIDAKLPMVVASNDFPTIIYGWDIGSQLLELYENGYLADLTEYYTDGTLDQLTRWLPLEDAEPYIYQKAKTEEGEYYLLPVEIKASTLSTIWDAIGFESELLDKEYYNLYASTPSSATGRGGTQAIMVRTDILKALRPDALTIDEIEQIYAEEGTFTEEQIYSVNINSAEEFFDFLREVKELISSEEYVGLDGKPMEVMYGPHTETDNWGWMYALPSLIDGANIDYFSIVNLAADKESEVIQWAYSSDYYIDFMKELNALVREDVISQNSLLDNSAMFKEKMNNQHYAVTYWDNIINMNKDIESEVDYTPIWVNVPFNNELSAVRAFSHGNYCGIFKDSLSEDELDQLMHAINYLHSIVGTNNFYWGPKTAGLFTEDAEGNRTYTEEALYNCMILKEDNGKAAEYGLRGTGISKNGFTLRPDSVVQELLNPSYLCASSIERQEANAYRYFCPGLLAGQSNRENNVPIKVGYSVYGSLNAKVPGLQTFWAARNGYEDMVKKVLVSESDEEFEKRFNDLKVFAEENGLTEETRKQYNDLFMEANRDSLAIAGITFK